VLIDTTPDLRLQALNNNLRKLDAILFTHSHADHIFGLDDVRRFCLLQNGAIACYASRRCAADIRRIFDYALLENAHLQSSFCPLIELRELSKAFELFGRLVQPIPLIHAGEPILGFRVGNFAYCTDCSEIKADSLDKLAGLEVLVLGALRSKPHPAHLSIGQAVEVAQKLRARQTFFVHMGHSVSHATVSAELPERIFLAYDGLQIEVSEA
jgi:phosphoribosyl 1,2-cyclic phosphate phosphodiesterase